MFKIEDVMKSQRANGPAAVMAIGTANPPKCFEQNKFSDFYFEVTKSEHKTDLKEKLKRICDKSAIRNRYMHLTEDMLERNPGMCEDGAPSLNARQDIVVVEVPKLGTEAAQKAIKEWGRSKSEITHLIFSTSSGVDMPGADYQLTKLLGLSLSVKRYMFYNHGCFAGGTGLRLAKDLAENNKGARVLVVCVEMMAAFFQGPSDTNHDTLVVVSLFGDGAGAVIVGSDPINGVEKPVFEIVTGTQTLIPDSGSAIRGALRESGLNVHLHKDVPTLISNNIKKILVEVFKPLGSTPDWNSLFWVVHAGGRAILDKLEQELCLDPIKLGSTRHVLSEFGNLACACTFFVLDDMRKKFEEEKVTTGGGAAPEFGVLVSFGPGLTVEALVLRSIYA